jgi:hypothetical protein
MAEDMFNVASRVQDEKSFLDFLESLAADRESEVGMEKAKSSSPYGPGVKGWENGSIEAFLEAASAWGKVTASGGAEAKINPWQRCAQILSAGKFYE